MQRNWIGRSHGFQLRFDVAPNLEDGSAIRSALRLEVFTTRPDTLFGVTYLVIAPEHPLVDALTSEAQRASVMQYLEAASRKSDFERTELVKTKTGVWTGSSALNPVNGEAVPIWVADYVVGGYGTGAVMAVPAHDVRDFQFACTYNLPIRAVVAAAGSEAVTLPFAGLGIAMHSRNSSDLDVDGTLAALQISQF